MSDANTKELGELITLLRIDVAKLMQKVDSFHRIETKLDQTVLVADRASQSVDSAHKRINKLESWQRYVIGTALTCLGITISGVALIWNILK